MEIDLKYGAPNPQSQQTIQRIKCPMPEFFEATTKVVEVTSYHLFTVYPFLWRRYPKKLELRPSLTLLVMAPVTLLAQWSQFIQP